MRCFDFRLIFLEIGIFIDMLAASSLWPGSGLLPDGPASSSSASCLKGRPHWSGLLRNASCLLGRTPAMDLLMPPAQPPLLSSSFGFMGCGNWDCGYSLNMLYLCNTVYLYTVLLSWRFLHFFLFWGVFSWSEVRSWDSDVVCVQIVKHSEANL